MTTSQGIVVLGMHRSGTSATTHLLGELGCEFGGELLAGREDNPDGYFEHKDVVETHNDFLRAVGRAWDDPRPWQGELESEAAAEARQHLAEIFERDFASRKLWVLKDPRLCRLLPLWSEILDRADVRFAVVHRHPLAVARSLERRDGMHRSRALMLWLRHVLEAERWTRGRRRAYFRFERLIADPQTILTGVMGRLGLSHVLDGSAEAAQRSLEPSQVHHRADDDDRRLLRSDFPWVERCHRALGELDDAGPGVYSREAEALRAELGVADRLYHLGLVVPLVDALSDSNADRSQLRRALREKERDLSSLRDDLERQTQQQDSYVASLKETNAVQDTYVLSLKETLQRTESYSKSLERRMEDSEAASAEYIASLRESLESKDRYAAELQLRIQALEGE